MILQENEDSPEKGIIPGLFLYIDLFFIVLSSSLKCLFSFYLIFETHIKCNLRVEKVP